MRRRAVDDQGNRSRRCESQISRSGTPVSSHPADGAAKQAANPASRRAPELAPRSKDLAAVGILGDHNLQHLLDRLKRINDTIPRLVTEIMRTPIAPNSHLMQGVAIE